jgi:hypothetical protein
LSTKLGNDNIPWPLQVPFQNLDGTAALPSYTFANDVDTGIYRVGTNSIGYTVGGSKKVEVNTSGLSVNSAILLPLNGTLNWSSGTFIMTGASGAFTVEGSSSTVPTYTLKSNEAGTTGVTLNLEHASASPANNDIPTLIQSIGKDSGGNQQVYGQLYWQITDTTNTSEDSTSTWNYWEAGAAVSATWGTNGLQIPRMIDLSGGSGNGGKIRFPSTQIASAGANDFDDYEEGTFTPGMTFGGSAASVTFSTQTGVYTKIGDTVFFAIQIILTNNGSGTGTALVTGLPFTPSGAVNQACSIVSVGGLSGLTGALVAVVSAGGTTIALYQTISTGASVLTDTQVTNTANLYIAGTYKAP